MLVGLVIYLLRPVQDLPQPDQEPAAAPGLDDDVVVPPQRPPTPPPPQPPANENIQQPQVD